jgi:ABC-type ATPase involved in cell division
MAARRSGRATSSNSFDSGISGLPRLSKSAAIYGPNAAGKTNLLKAMHFVQQFVTSSASSPPGNQVPYTPFIFSKTTRAQPSEFVIAFIERGIRYQYGFKLNATRILEEWLFEYVTNRGRLLFERVYHAKTERYKWTFSSFLKGQRSVWSETTRPNALFLSNASQLNSGQLLPVFQWFQRRLVIIMPGSPLNPGLTIQLLDKPDGKEKLLPFLREADLGIADVHMDREIVPGTGALILPGAFIEQQPNSSPSVVRITLRHQGADDQSPLLPLSEESSGTQILFATAGAWLNVFTNAEVLLVDEIDTSLHPLLTHFLIQKFHSDKTNPNNAQLLFTTHNTTLLDQKLFRRDQIWFMEKGRDGSTKMFPLSDFKVRKGEALDKWYLKGRYGALPLLDESVT